MTYLVKNVCIDQPVLKEDGTEQQILRTTFQYDQEVDFPFILGETTSIFSANPFQEKNGIGKVRTIKHPFINEAGFFKQVINVGEFGWYFVRLPYGMTFQSLLFQPTDLDIDLCVSDTKHLYKDLKKHNEKLDPFDQGLLFCFYNATKSSNISITGRIVKDTRGIYSKLKANSEDLELRHYYLKSCLAKTVAPGEYTEPVPDLMNMDEAAKYLGIRAKTLYNWVSDQRILVTKVGRLNKFRKEDLDRYLENQTH